MTDPTLEARCKTFERYLVVDRGFAAITAMQRRNIVRRFLAQWRTLAPSKEQVQTLKEEYVLKGFDRDYARNICISFRNYGEFIASDLTVKPPSKPKPRVPRFLTEHEVQNILFTIDSVRDRALFFVLAYTGLRCAEICALRRDDVNFEKRTVVVQNGKGGKSAEIPISAAALEALSLYLRSGLRPLDASFLFPAPDGDALSRERVRRLAARYGRKGGVQKRVTPHMFRHALATNLLSKGCPLPFVQKQLRHSRIETTMAYLHLTDAHLRDNYERFLPDY